MKKILFVALSLLLLLAFGCSHDTNNSSVTNPNPNTVYPKGYIQGTVRDACSQAPIVNAVVDIGIARATTNARGQYIMTNVPATSYIDRTEIDGELEFNDNEVEIDAEIDTGYRGHYSATIDMTKASIGGVKVTNYANYYYDEVAVAFSSLEPSSGIVSADDADVTPVLGLMNGDYDFYLGKLTTGITGYAVYADTNQPVPDGYKVYLFSHYRGNQQNSTTGITGNKVGETTTVGGKFVFTGLEAKQQFGIFVVDTALDTARFMGMKDVTTDCNGSMFFFGIQDGQAIKVSSTDVVCPFPLSIKADGHGNYVDIAKEEIADGVNVVFTFSEPILPTELNTGRGLTPTFLSGSGSIPEASLYFDIAVNYEGYKVGNIEHSLAWNTEMTQLTVNIPAGMLQPSSVYSVKITGNRNLMDYNGNYLIKSLNESCSKYPNETSIEYWFTTWGAPTAEKVTDLRYYNREDSNDGTQLDYDDRTTLDWTSPYGAKGYNIYCQMIQWHGEEPPMGTGGGASTYTGEPHGFILMRTTNVTGRAPLDFQGNDNYPFSHSDWFEFVESWNVPLTYECFVRSLNADGQEAKDPETGAYIDSNHVFIGDTDRPHITSVSNLEYGDTISRVRVCFSEPMNEASVQNATWTVNTGAFETGTGYGANVVLENYDTYSMCFTVSFDDAYRAQLISSVTQASCSSSTVLVPVLSMTGEITDVAGNLLQDPSEHCVGCTVGRLPVTITVPCYEP